MPQGASTSSATCAGAIQFGLGIWLLVLGSSQSFRHAGPDSCVFGAASISEGQQVCDGLSFLALISIFAALVISVAQGACSLALGFPPRVLEVLLRAVLAVVWLGLAIVTTIAGVQADRRDHNADRSYYRHVGIGLAWAMAVASGCMALSALVGACCIDLPVWALCCCCAWLGLCPPTGHHHHHHHHHAHVSLCDTQCSDTCTECCTILGLAWFLRLWFPSSAPPCPHPHYPPPPPGGGYQPLPPSGAGGYPPHTYQPPTVYVDPRSNAAAPPPSHGYPPSGGAPPGYVPVMAPVYSPFTQGSHVPPTVGWGVPAVPAGLAPGPAGGAPPPPAPGGGGGADPGRPPAAWYPDVPPHGAQPPASTYGAPGGSTGSSTGQGYAGAPTWAAAPPKEGYEPPSAPPRG